MKLNIFLNKETIWKKIRETNILFLAILKGRTSGIEKLKFDLEPKCMIYETEILSQIRSSSKLLVY